MPQVLLIEDEPGIANNVIYALETEGMDVMWHPTGSDALADFQIHPIDIVVLDIGLPDTNGFEVFQKLRATRFTPVIFLTARSEEIDRIVGLEMGADDYMTKPFSPRELAARIRAVLRRGNSMGSATTDTNHATHSSPLTVDNAGCCIQYHGHRLELTAYQYRILKHLIGHPGQVISRSSLMEAAWGEPDVALERTVDSHIKTIRSKLRELRAVDHLIKTHRGHGYAYHPHP